jgi:hypothetical protein
MAIVDGIERHVPLLAAVHCSRSTLFHWAVQPARSTLMFYVICGVPLTLQLGSSQTVSCLQVGFFLLAEHWVLLTKPMSRQSLARYWSAQ